MMEIEYWQNKWQNKDIAFHQQHFHPFLVNHFDKLALAHGTRVFLPLCGKTRDIVWLISQGYQVVGVELIEPAIVQLFAELDITPNISAKGRLKHYSAKSIDIFVGDIFDLDVKVVGTIDAIYDRAALVALPADIRTSYAAFISQLSHNAPHLLICFDYEQSLLAGPPFSVNQAEVLGHYENQYDAILIEQREVDGGLKGQCPAIESVWTLIRKE